MRLVSPPKLQLGKGLEFHLHQQDNVLLFLLQLGVFKEYFLKRDSVARKEMGLTLTF